MMEVPDEELQICKCEHEESHSDDAIWIKPSASEKVLSPAQKRQYCKKCGKIKYHGTSRARKIGFYVNLLREIQKKVEVLHRRKISRNKLTKVQLRLILKELEEDDEFLDRFSNNLNNQWRYFKEIVRKHTDIDDEVLESIYRDFKG